MKSQKNKTHCCFLADTKVRLPSSLSKISTVVVGQEIMGYDLASAQVATGKVMRVDIDCEPVILRIEFTDKDKLICTPSQRLFCRDKWILAGDLRVGMTLSEKICASITAEKWQKEVYTLVVEPMNNYIVLSQNQAEFIAHDNSSDLGYPADFSIEKNVEH